MTEQALQEMPTEVNNPNVSFEQLKAIGALPISATAKYIGTIMASTGARSVADICAVTGLPKSTVYRAQKEFAEHASDLVLTIPTVLTSEILTIPTDGKITEKTVSLVSPVRNSEPEPSCARDITTRPTKELPSEVSLYEEVDSPLVSPKLKTQAEPKTVRGSRLADDWQLPDDWRAWTAVNCPLSTPEAIRVEALKFSNYWQSQPGAKARKLDWRKTWQNWSLQAFASGPTRQQTAYQRPTSGLTAKQIAGRATLANIDARIASYNS